MKVLRKIWKKWIAFGKILGNFNGQVFFTIFYFIALSLLGIIFAFFQDPLKIKTKRKSNFDRWEHPYDDLAQARKPY